MSEKTQVIELVKIKSWYIPATPDAYQLLKSIKVPLLKVHKDFIPTLRLATDPRGIRARSIDFSTILHERLDKIGVQWKSKPGRTCKLTDNRLVFSAPCSDRNRRAVANLESAFARFCQRWGFRCVPLYSERDNKLRLVVDYSFDPGRNPVIDSAQVPAEQAFELVLGFTRIKLTFMDRPTSQGQARPPLIHTEVSIQQGSDWKVVHTGTSTNNQIGDLSQFLTCLGRLHTNRQVLEDGGQVSEQPVMLGAKPLRPEVVTQLRELTRQVETALVGITLDENETMNQQRIDELVAVGRKLPRLNTRLAEAGIALEVSRQSLVQYLTNAQSLWPYLFDPKYDQQVIPCSPDLIDEMCAEGWPRLLRLKAAWISAEFNDPEQAKATLLASIQERRLRFRTPVPQQHPTVADL